ncbi:hypothetical protein [Streptomyces jeddahensis]|uniref:Uncharacterized protein n=1 Tax=Streptomyces jeddahensis TaxID=1716141 RepID=A0A177HUF0_9ACTN|nr:hypothetical protein [Streptomyces jeddahensis]OAH14147.1 hypothetical protein STSP_25970 [Streptomyces jeddahensis]
MRIRRTKGMLAVVAAGRVDSIVSLHAEMAGAAEDAYPAVQVVESYWREFGGLGDESELRQAARAKVEGLRAATEGSGRPWMVAVTAALDAISGLIDLGIDEARCRAQAIGSAFSVALEFDQKGLTPPAGATSWFAFEAAGQAAAADQLLSSGDPLSKEEVFNLRIGAGSDAMHYHRALKEWMRNG